MLHSAFIPFGDIKDVNIPLDNTTGKHRGFAFVEFEDKDDAGAATDNMHNAELWAVLPINVSLKFKRNGRKGEHPAFGNFNFAAVAWSAKVILLMVLRKWEIEK
jgi:hypothetical protein